ncbi:hypothetical protein ACFYOT_26140 [Saccharothrix saharensis]|uniref:hypothetical protein n=1 Tax=Saccharothrix saharensis TaxID=571190 RepID=UPI00369ECD29
MSLLIKGAVVRVLHGRDAILEIATNLIVRGSPVSGDARRAERRIPPALVLVGPGGSGKSAVLAELDGRLGDQPHVLVDAARTGRDGTSPVLDLLTAVMFELARHDARRFRFSRFLVGRLITEVDLDDGNVDRAHRQAEAELRRVDPATISGRVAAMITLLPDQTGMPDAADAVQQFLPPLIEGLTRTRWGRRAALLSGHEWYGHRDRDRRRDAVAELVALNRLRRLGGDEGQAEVDRTLMEAFLADVRHAVRRGTVDPVLLLDNADHESGVEFLRALADIRYAPATDYPHDHLTVIAGGNGTLVESLEIAKDEVPVDDPTVVERVRTGRLDVKGPWLALPLRDLTEPEMLPLAEEIGIEAQHRHRVVRVLRDLTRGHPGGTAQLMRAAALVGADTACPEDMLAQEVPAPPSRDRNAARAKPAAEVVLDMFLADLPATLRYDLTTCAAARDHDEAAVIAGSPMTGTAFHDQQPLLSAAHWSPREPGGEPVMHPLLRLLLLRELAKRPASAKTSWRSVFGLLAENAEHEDDRLHHLFARGDTDVVVQRLVDLLRERGGRQWLALVRSLATCPAHPDLAGARVERTGDGPVDAVTAVLTAWRAGADPLEVGRRADLHGVVYTEMPVLAREARGDHGEFVSVAAEHLELAKRWRDVRCGEPAGDEWGSGR